MKTKTYPTLLKAQFPEGIHCKWCGQHIKPGQPYDEADEEFDFEESVLTVNIICVYH